MFHGMELDPVADPTKRFNENGILFLVYYYLIKFKAGLLSEEDMITFRNIVEALEVDRYPGLYDRGAGESRTLAPEKLRTISHDNLTAIAGFSRKFGMRYGQEIFEHGLKNLFRFDNAYPESPRWKRIQHPRDIAFWAHAAVRPELFILFSPILFFSNIITCLTSKAETSGKLLMWLRLETMNQQSIFTKVNKFICYNLLKLKYGNDWLQQILSIYFKNPEHPINILAASKKA